VSGLARPLVTLDPDSAFEAALIEMVGIYRSKRADYALDVDPFSNFRQSADVVGLDGFGPVEAALHLVGVKLARLRALRGNGRGPVNESVLDTYRDLAVYGVIVLALATERAALSEAGLP
jgi:hypothetical protein